MTHSLPSPTPSPIEALDQAILAITPKPDLSKEEAEVIDLLYALKFYLLSPENIYQYLPTSAHHALSNLTLAMVNPSSTLITVDPTVISQDDPLALDPDPITPSTGTISLSSMPPTSPPTPSVAHVSQSETPSRLEEFLTSPFKKRKKTT